MSQTLKFGNKTWATKVGSTLAYNDENGNYKPLPFAFTRSTSATRVNKEGLIEVVTNDRPRIDYTDTSDGVLLLEKAATNLITYSEAFDNSSWTKSGSSVVSGFTSPSGDLSAFKLVEGTNNGNHRIFGSVLASNIYTISIFAKYNGRLLQLASTTTVGHYANFDLLNGVIGNYGSLTENPTIIELTNGWYKCSMTTTSNMNTPIVSAIQSITSEYQPDEQGDGTSGIYIYGSQIETGNLSSYIPTQGSASTRVAETASGAGNSEVFNDSQGILYANIGSFVGADNYRQITISDGSINNYILIGLRNDTGNIYFDSPFSSTFLTDVKPINSFAKCAFKYKVNDFSFWLNGFKVGVDTTTSVPVGLDTLNFDIIGVNDFYGKTKEIGYYNTILTDLELETLTSYKSWTSMVNELNLNIIYNG